MNPDPSPTVLWSCTEPAVPPSLLARADEVIE